MKFIQNIHPIVFLLIATTLEVTGDAVIRLSIFNHSGWVRIGFALIGTILLFGYGFFLNINAPEFMQ